MNRKPLILCYAVSVSVMLLVLGEQSVPFFLSMFMFSILLLVMLKDLDKLWLTTEALHYRKGNFLLGTYITKFKIWCEGSMGLCKFGTIMNMDRL
jgi:hypothetical protein